LLTTIPFVLLVGPAIGYYLGSAIDGRLSSGPWGMGMGIALGVISSARVTIQLIRQSKDADPHQHD